MVSYICLVVVLVLVATAASTDAHKLLQTCTQVSCFCQGKVAGDYANPFDSTCRSFIKCANGVSYLQYCASGLIFNPKVKNCDWPTNYVCGSTGSTSTAAPPPTASSPPPTTTTTTTTTTTAWRTGWMTWYNHVGTTACGNYISGDGDYAAISWALADKMNTKTLWPPSWCGRQIQLTGPKGTAYVRAIDKCGACSENDLDVAPTIFKQVVGDLGIGKAFGIKWRFV